MSKSTSMPMRSRSIQWIPAAPLPLAVLLALSCGCRDSTPAPGTTATPSPPREEPATTPESERQPVAGREAAGTKTPAIDYVAQIAKGALILDGLGDLQREITSNSPDALEYFDQGLRLTYAFNHDEAARSYAKAAEIDPSCASCYWGLAYVLGPNYNVPMLPGRAAAAWQALQKARALATRATPIEQALIAALAERYPGPEPKTPAEMQPFSMAYAKAMRDVARRYPEDDDVQVLFAEALMDVHPWNLYLPAGEPGPDTEEIVATLEKVLARNARHPGANHYYIHAIEPSKSPERGVPSADRLGAMMPGAGHVVHMPAHIYQRVGRYADAIAANEAAVAADERYIERAKPTGYYPMYLAHNYGFLSWSASMLGRKEQSTRSAEASAKAMPAEMLSMAPGMDYFTAAPHFVSVRFGDWQKALDAPPPPESYPVLTALWRHARGMALASTGKIAEARQEFAAIEALQPKIPEEARAGNNPARKVVELAGLTVAARIAEREKSKDAIDKWREAVELEDRLQYAEPADWYYPLRHYLGAALLDAKRSAEAEAVYRADLKDHPDNGWALFGLMQSLKAQGKRKEAARVQKQFTNAWKTADVKLTRSAF
jgi:tetratricopeptide (TPR) repeat protein